MYLATLLGYDLGFRWLRCTVRSAIGARLRGRRRPIICRPQEGGKVHELDHQPDIQPGRDINERLQGDLAIVLFLEPGDHALRLPNQRAKLLLRPISAQIANLVRQGSLKAVRHIAGAKPAILKIGRSDSNPLRSATHRCA